MTEQSYDPLDGSEKYRAIRELGRGGMGEVFLGEHLALGTKVVLKLLHLELSNKTGLVDRMRVEAQACARLNHPNIVRVTDFDRTPKGRPFFVMEYLPGRPLPDEVEARGGVLPVAEALDVTQQILAGLGHAHAAGLVHRDMKLDNLFVVDPEAQGGRRMVKILDFGVAKVLEGAGGDAPSPLMVPTGTGVVVGTPRFLAPEQARGRQLDHRADIYAAGLVLYSLVAGRGPFDDAKTVTEMAKAHVLTPPAPPSSLAPQPVPQGLDAAVLKAVAKNPDERYQSAEAFAADLANVATSLGSAQAASVTSTAYQAPPVDAGAPQPAQASGPQQSPRTAAGAPAQPAPFAEPSQPQAAPEPEGAAPTAPLGATAAPQPGGSTQAMGAVGAAKKRYSYAFAAMVLFICLLVGAAGALVALRMG